MPSRAMPPPLSAAPLSSSSSSPAAPTPRRPALSPATRACAASDSADAAGSGGAARKVRRVGDGDGNIDNEGEGDGDNDGDGGINGDGDINGDDPADALAPLAIRLSPAVDISNLSFRINAPPTDRPVRIYCDGIFDLFHYGHAGCLEQAKRAFESVFLIVGVCNDDVTHQFKGKTVMNEIERFESLRHCKWVDLVVENAPWIITQEFIDMYKIDYVAHDNIPYASADCNDVYGFVKLQGKFLPTRRTEGISTSDIITRIVRDYDQYLRRNLARGVSPKDLNIGFFKEKQLMMEKSVREIKDEIKSEIEEWKGEWKETYRFWEERSSHYIKEFAGLFRNPPEFVAKFLRMKASTIGIKRQFIPSNPDYANDDLSSSFSLPTSSSLSLSSLLSSSRSNLNSTSAATTSSIKNSSKSLISKSDHDNSDRKSCSLNDDDCSFSNSSGDSSGESDNDYDILTESESFCSGDDDNERVGNPEAFSSSLVAKSEPGSMHLPASAALGEISLLLNSDNLGMRQIDNNYSGDISRKLTASSSSSGKQATEFENGGLNTGMSKKLISETSRKKHKPKNAARKLKTSKNSANDNSLLTRFSSSENQFSKIASNSASAANIIVPEAALSKRTSPSADSTNSPYNSSNKRRRT